jgi:DNA gyrase subunit A
MFATNKGTVRRNSLTDFKNVASNGKIAMKLDDGDRLTSVRVCDDTQHILLSTKHGKCVRFPVISVREFKSRASTGVRGIKMSGGNEVTSMSVLNGTELADILVREEYLKIPSPVRSELSSLLWKLEEGESKKEANEQNISFVDIEGKVEEIISGIISTLSKDVIKDWARNEQFIITITENGYGKRSSAYEYRVTNRGGSGIVNIITSARNGEVVASYQIEDTDQLMLITTKGRLIRCPVHDVRITGRNTQGVTIFKTNGDEKVISVAKIEDAEGDVEED